MDRAAWEEEWAKAWDEYRRAHEAWDTAMPAAQFGLSALLESVDTARVNQLKSELDEAWHRIVELGANRPDA